MPQVPRLFVRLLVRSFVWMFWVSLPRLLLSLLPLVFQDAWCFLSVALIYFVLVCVAVARLDEDITSVL